jgi:predicted DCC family thiol-disulfide oxidoreductase YuxK
VPIRDEPSLIIYDGDCLYCQNYVRFVRLREAIGRVDLLDARSDDPRIEQYWRDGYDLNEGMLFVYRGEVHHGANAIHMLASLSSRNDTLNRINARLFANKGVARFLYPLLKVGRRLTLIARGRSLLKRP